ncbi:putative Isomerase [metagenome]|uniref:Putative Isomerase n=1 Tax=metagenome TaxID=256318 RepID=A0A2P2CFA7_9ZZZZ
MQLLLIRHAQTHANVTRALDTAHPGADLTDLGTAQVQALTDQLAHERIDAVFASPRLRARRTAEGLALPRGLALELRDGLVEISAGDHEMSEETEHATAYVESVLAWAAGDLSSTLPGGESGAHALGRFDAVVDEVLATGHDTVAVVSHGAMLRTWCGARVGNVPHDLVRDHPLPNTGLIRLRRDGDAWAAAAWDGQPITSH